MFKLNAVLLVLMFGAVTSHAGWKIKNNPDHVPSVGVDLETVKGRDRVSTDKTTDHRAVVSLRLPVTPFLTVEAGHIHEVHQLQSAQFNTVSDIHGNGFRVGVRLYLTK